MNVREQNWLGVETFFAQPFRSEPGPRRFNFGQTFTPYVPTHLLAPKMPVSVYGVPRNQAVGPFGVRPPVARGLGSAEAQNALEVFPDLAKMGLQAFLESERAKTEADRLKAAVEIERVNAEAAKALAIEKERIRNAPVTTGSFGPSPLVVLGGLAMVGLGVGVLAMTGGNS